MIGDAVDGDGVALLVAEARFGVGVVVLPELFGVVCDVALTGADGATFAPAFDPVFDAGGDALFAGAELGDPVDGDAVDGGGVVLLVAELSLGLVPVVLAELFGAVCVVAFTGPDGAAFDPVFDAAGAALFTGAELGDAVDGDGVVLLVAEPGLGLGLLLLEELSGAVCVVAFTGPDGAAFDPPFDPELGGVDDAGAEVEGATSRAEPALGVVLPRPWDPLGELP